MEGNADIGEVMQEQVVQNKLSEILFENAMKGQWKQVVETYESNAYSHKAMLTASWDTALHLAVSDGKTEIVSKLVKSVVKGKDKQILKLKNNRGNTALHSAAALGHSEMCHCMASEDHNLIAERNEDKATPLFLAAQFGHEDAFLCLHFLYERNIEGDVVPLETSCRKANGDTILHAALNGEFFSKSLLIWYIS